MHLFLPEAEWTPGSLFVKISFKGGGLFGKKRPIDWCNVFMFKKNKQDTFNKTKYLSKSNIWNGFKTQHILINNQVKP